MKRLALVLTILAMGTSVFCALQHGAAQARAALATNQDAVAAQAQALAEARTELTELTEHVRELKRTLPGLTPPRAEESALLQIILTNGVPQLSPAQRERLLAELGFNWNTTSDYLVVSKDTLRGISMAGMKGDKLTDVSSSVLAVTPTERAAIEGEAKQLRAEYKSWVETHVKREEPSGAVVAKYLIPADAEFSLGRKNQFTSSVMSTLGEQRGELLLAYATDWMADMEMYASDPTTLTIKRYNAGSDARLTLELKHGGSVMSADVTPYQPVPGPFRPLFPNGWPDLAQREGFELPKEFSKAKGK